MPENAEILRQHYTHMLSLIAQIHTEPPPQVKEWVLISAEYKHGIQQHTTKVTQQIKVVCYSPCGFISFLSKDFGGHANHSFIINDCGFLNLLKPGDTILADKKFPIINT